jgi:hypothetical protein
MASLQYATCSIRRDTGFHLLNHGSICAAAGSAGRTGCCRDISVHWHTSILLFGRLPHPALPTISSPLKDPALQSPGWGVVGGIVGIAIVSAVIVILPASQ